VLEAAETVINEARKAGIFPGVSTGDNVDQLIEWANKGAQWLSIGVDFLHLTHGVEMVTNQIRKHLDLKL
jgi:hypothetical protein